MEKKKIFTIRRLIVTLFLIIFAITAYVSYRGSFLEFKELGENYLKTFLTKQKYQYNVMIFNFIFVFLIMYFSGRRIKKGLRTFFEQEKKEMPRLPNKSIALVVASIESLIVTKIFTPNIILLMSNTAVGETDPVFGLDISFFMFIEPLIKMGIMYLICLLIATIVYAFGYYVIVFNKFFDGIDRETLKNSPMMKTIYRNIKLIAICLSSFIVISSLDIVFDNFLTTDNNIKLAGAGIVDRTIKIWGNIVLSVILLIAVFKALNSLKRGKQTKVLKDLAIVPIYLVALFIVMTVFSFAFVRPNRFDKEKKYIEANIYSTKKAYAIDCNVETIDYSGTITANEVQKNESIIDNTVIVDKNIVLKYLNENQTGTGYYTYKTAKLSNYNIDGEKKLVFVTPREIFNNKRTFDSKTYEYTHGYGLVFTDATNYTEEGRVQYIQNDISGDDAKITINKPQIYYGLETNGMVITNTNDKKEFDYSDGKQDYETTYEGNSGLSLNFIDRLILGLKQKNINIAFSDANSKNSKVLINRNILKRAKMALPDVVYDSDPYTVVDKEGNIYWVIDAYTISSSYPYSTYTEIQYDNQKRGINYIRNSIKVITNAYTGEMKFYITDRTDTIAMAYRKVYPELFQDLNEKISDEIKEQFIYPEFLYKVQSGLLEEYHNTKADVLYRSDDTWEKSTYKNSQSSNKAKNTTEAYYTVVNIDNEEKMGLIQFYSQKGKQSINSYLIGTVEQGKNKLHLRTFKSDTSILGPTQLDAQIALDENIQKQIDGLNVTGAKITKEMIVVPIENTVLYIEPIYQTLINESNLPVLKKVIVASGNKLTIGNNLQEAIEQLISQSAASIDVNTTEDLEGILDSIIKANGNLSESLKSNNWELMGSDIQKLQELINSLERQLEEEKKAKENTTNEISNNTTIENTVVE